MKLRQLSDLVIPVVTWNPARLGPEESFQYIDLSAVDQDMKSIVGARKVGCGEAPSRARQLVEAGDILVSTVRPNLNGVARVPEELDGATASTGFCVVRPKPELLDSSYLFHWVKSAEFINDMVKKATGASYPAVSDRIVLESMIPLPSLSEQRRIAAVLDQAEALRAKRQEVLSQLDELQRAIFAELFGSPNSKSMKKEPIGSLLKLKSGDFLPSASMAGNGIYPVFGGNGINGYHDKYMFDSPKIVIGRVGVYCGCVHISPEKSWITDNALFVSDLDSRLEFDYLAFALKQARLNQYASQSAQPLISGSRIYPVEIIVPPKDKQLDFIIKINKISAFEKKAKYSHEILNDLFSCLQYHAFQGGL